MVELSETSDILRTITPRTLVILDECVEDLLDSLVLICWISLADSVEERGEQDHISSALIAYTRQYL